MESIIREAVFDHMDANNFLVECQHGFISKRSCVTNFLCILDSWTKYLDESLPVDAIYLDFAKAFDSLPHQRMLNKLVSYGIKENLLTWIKEFLVGRKQRVGLNGSFSSWASVSSGVPQGSVLGPVLFVIFINDMPEVVDSICQMYADDTKIFYPVDSKQSGEQLQQDLDNLMKWSHKWQLRFNAGKCKVLHLGRSNQEYTYCMKDHGSDKIENLESSEGEKDLGILVDHELKFSRHVETQVNKANKILGMVRRSYQYLDGETLRMLFTALIRPHLEFANVAWSPRYQ